MKYRFHEMQHIMILLRPALTVHRQDTHIGSALCRCGGIAWGDDSLALLYESWYKTRRSRVWTIAPGEPAKEPQLLFDRDYEDAYTDPGSPANRRTKRGTYVLAQIEGIRQLIMQGRVNWCPFSLSLISIT
jgi:hypothetical protein